MNRTFPERLKTGFIRFKGQILLQAMVIPGIVWLFIFCYLPMYGITIAFKDYKPQLGFFGGPWAGTKHFREFFNDSFAVESIGNTLIISFYKLLAGFPAPILFSLLLNELRNLKLKKTAQTVSYLPFFISWVVIASLMQTLLGVEGPLNDFLMSVGWIDKKIVFLAKPEYFRAIAVVSDIWKGIGWNSIIYLAAISSIPQDMYEAAYMDGAGRLRRIWHITLPSISPTIVLLLILAVSGILGSNFEQHLLLKNPQNAIVAETIDTYVFQTGLQQGRHSFATAISLMRSLIAFLLLFSADRMARIVTHGEQGLF